MQDLHVHTDGSSDNRVKEAGWAFCISYGVSSEPIHQDSGYVDGTNNKAELLGVLNSLHYIDGNHKTKRVTIYTDSKYVSDTVYFDYYGWYNENWQVMEKGKLVDRKNKELWIELRNKIHLMKMRGVSVDIRWVRGHNGNKLNEVVDKLAGAARLGKKINPLY